MTLKELRLAVGIPTQTELANRANVAQSLVSDLEAGIRRKPSAVSLQRIAKALGVPLTVVVAAVLSDSEAA